MKTRSLRGTSLQMFGCAEDMGAGMRVDGAIMSRKLQVFFIDVTAMFQSRGEVEHVFRTGTATCKCAEKNCLLVKVSAVPSLCVAQRKEISDGFS